MFICSVKSLYFCTYADKGDDKKKIKKIVAFAESDSSGGFRELTPICVIKTLQLSLCVVQVGLGLKSKMNVFISKSHDMFKSKFDLCFFLAKNNVFHCSAALFLTTIYIYFTLSKSLRTCNCSTLKLLFLDKWFSGWYHKTLRTLRASFEIPP